MKLLSSSFRSLMLALAIMVFMTSCAKEELVGPCSRTDETHSTDLRLGTADGDDADDTDPSGSATSSSGSGGDEEGIGDDGDDLPDSERNRKKRLN